MLEAIGPKYAGTVDCFMRILQLYGSTVAQLLDPAFEFASAERSGVGVPLLDYLEGIMREPILEGARCCGAPWAL